MEIKFMDKRLHQHSKRSSAIGLIELMLVLALIAVLAVVSVKYYKSVQNAAKVNQVITDLQTIHDAVKNWAEMNSDWVNTPLTLNSLVTDNLLPARFLGPQADLWGAVYNLQKVNNSGKTFVNISFTFMEAKYCKAILAKTKGIVFSNFSCMTYFDPSLNYLITQIAVDDL